MHIVRNSATQKYWHPIHVMPLNEHELVRAGLPAGAAVHDAQTQTVGTEFPALQTFQPLPAKQPARLLLDAYTAGTRLVQHWSLGNGTREKLTCTVMDVRTSATGRHEYQLKFDDERWKNDPAWPPDMWYDLQRADGPVTTLAPEQGGSVPQTTGQDQRNENVVPDGGHMSILLVCGGDDDQIDNVKARVQKRYPLARVDNVDVKSDPVLQDLHRRDVRNGIKAKIAGNEYNMVYFSIPCTTMTVRSGIMYRSKDEPWQRKKPHDKWPPLTKVQQERVKEHNVYLTFMESCIEMCEHRKIPWGAEGAADRSSTNLRDISWPEFAGFACLSDFPLMKKRIADGRAKRYHIATCEFDSDAQKYLMFIISQQLMVVGDRVLGNKMCTHAQHASLIAGPADDDKNDTVARQSEEYVPKLADGIAMILTEPLLKTNEKPAGVPAYDQRPRTPLPPAVPRTIHSSMDAFAAEVYEAIERMTGEDIGTIIARNEERIRGTPYEACKATQGDVEVNTPLGVRVIRVPKTTKQLMESDEMPNWLEADEIGLNAILSLGNVPKRIDAVPKEAPIAECVTARKIKKDQATGGLAEKNAFKARHSVDGNRLAAFRRKLGLPAAEGGTTNTVDDFVWKLFVAEGAKQGHHFFKLDIGNAYAKGKRARPYGYMRMPKSLIDMHISDTNNPSDYLTKFVPAKKYNSSIYYLTNKRTRDAYA